VRGHKTEEKLMLLH